ncbi:glycosyltransferase family 4 protein [Nocardioides sp. HB32]
MKAPRLLILNNLPSYYRTHLYRAMLNEFASRTGGSGMVAYQYRRSPAERDDWFFTPDDELDFSHTFLADRPRRIRNRSFSAHPGLHLFARFRPTHVFAAGWSTSASVLASAYCRATGAQLGAWVESSRLTSKNLSRPAVAFRRSWLSPASYCVVPSGASEEYVRELARREVQVLRLLNPVELSRLADPTGVASPRAVFLGDYSARKGFDRFVEAARILGPRGVGAVAWGTDRDNLRQSAAGLVDVRNPERLSAIAPQLHGRDVLVIPSRVDPAPLTYSEALSLGLRVVVSDQIAYRDHASRTGGVAVVDCSRPEDIADAVERLANGSRPDASAADEVSAQHFARTVTSAMMGDGRGGRA